MPIAVDILLGLEAATTAASMFTKNKSSGVADTEYQIRETQDQMRSIQQGERAQTKQVKTMSQQAADESTTGFVSTSPSYKSMSMASYDAFLNDENAIALNNQFQQDALEARRSEGQANNMASMFNLLGRFGFEAFNTASIGHRGSAPSSKG